MLPCVKVFKGELLKCIDDCIDILETDFKHDRDAIKLVGELKVAKTWIIPLHEKGTIDLLNTFMKSVMPLKERISQRDKRFFEEVDHCKHCLDETCLENCICSNKCESECVCSDSCLNCSVVVTMDSKTFKAIKKIMKMGKEEDVEIMFAYIDNFIASGERYRIVTKEKKE